MNLSRSALSLRLGTTLLLGAALVAIPAFAQQDQAPPPPPDSHMQGPPPGDRGGMIDPDRSSQMMKQALNLSDDQTAQIRHILEETRSKLEAMRDSTSLSQGDRRSQMMALHQSVSERISAVLTPEQRTKFQEMQQQMRDRMRQQHEGDAGASPAPPPPSPPAPQL